MVWLHGGGFSGGSGNWLLYEGTNLARKEDVVMVSVTHRLNLFGFLYLSDLGGGEKWANASNAACRTSSPRWRGSKRTSPRSAAIPTTSPSSVNPAAAAR
jgi:carboxylesterase type B